jgi:hypothetical protein
MCQHFQFRDELSFRLDDLTCVKKKETDFYNKKHQGVGSAISFFRSMQV